ncbi:phosphopentomutase [Rhodobacteraceae bacterium]|nr:phosphopentomutase [Paracoccaceae bacterium]
MARAFLVVLDSVGIGGAPDADQFFNGQTPDTGANTLGHIMEACATDAASDGRSGALNIPNLSRLGISAAIRLANDLPEVGQPMPMGLWGAATEISKGKDTPSGHWELAGVPVPWDWHYFPDTSPAFPHDVSAEAARLAETDGILGNCHASGTEIIERLGAEHLRTGWPICYTSVDSVLQIAAHEERFGLTRLLDLCRDLAPMLHDMRVGRIIARPFVGEDGAFERTQNRKDFAIRTPAPTLCDWVSDAGGKVYGIGKIGDIFSMQGIDDVVKGPDAELMEHLIRLVGEAEDGSLTFANFVEFDTNFGHRRDVSGYARALEWFDAALPRVFDKMRADDLILFTADHGNDPTWIGTDHTRERVPVVGYGVGARAIGHVGFADVGASIAAHLGVDAQGHGQSFL